MDQRYVEGKSGSRVKPPRYGVSPSCSPLWRRYRHDCSAGNAGPWRRLYDIPECAWPGLIPSVRGQWGHELLSGARSRRGLSRRLRPVGPVAPSQGAGGGQRLGRADDPTRDRGYPGGPGGPFRARPGDGPDGRVHPSGHTPGQPGALRGTPLGTALVGLTAAGGRRAGLAGHGDASVPDARRRSAGIHSSRHPQQRTRHSGDQGAGGRATGVTALPQPPYPTPGRPAGHRGGEP